MKDDDWVAEVEPGVVIFVAPARSTPSNTVRAWLHRFGHRWIVDFDHDHRTGTLPAVVTYADWKAAHGLSGQETTREE